MRVWIAVVLALACMGTARGVYAEERKYLLLNEDPVSPLRNVDSGAGECLLRISEDHEVALTMANGKVARGWLRRGTPVVVNKDGVAWWVYNCGNAIVWPIGWKPEGPKECFSGRESTSCAPEKIVPTPTPTATPQKPVIRRQTRVVPQRTPAPRATPSPTPALQREEVVQVVRQDEQPLSPSPRMVTEEKKIPEKSDMASAGNTQVTNQSVSLSVEVKEERPRYLPKEPIQGSPKKETKKRRTGWVVGGIILGVVAAGAAAAFSERDGRSGGGSGGGGGGGPAPDPPNG